MGKVLPGELSCPCDRSCLYIYIFFRFPSQGKRWKGNIYIYIYSLALIYISGLEKLTNANRSVSTGNDRLFPVELTEIADWRSMSEYCYVQILEKK